MQKVYFRLHLTILQVIFEVKDHMGQGQKSHGSWSCDFRSHLTALKGMSGVKGQRSHGSRSKVAFVMLSLKVTILAGGLTSTSSCILLII